MDENQENDSQEVQPDKNEQGSDETADFKTQLSEKDTKIAELEETLGNAKRDLKKAEKPKSEPKKEVKETDEFGLLELTFLKGEDVKEQDEIDFVKKQLEEAGLTKDQLPKLFANKYFQSELNDLRTAKTNQEATSDVKGDGATGSKVKDAAYYAGLKDPSKLPEKTPENRKLRAEIARKMVKEQESGKKFYND